VVWGLFVMGVWFCGGSSGGWRDGKTRAIPVLGIESPWCFSLESEGT